MLKVTNLKKSYGDQQVLDHISFSVQRGDFLGIVGPSGAGKSTLLLLLGGMIEADEGQVTLGNEVVRGPNKKMQYVFQSLDQLLPWRTVTDNIAFPRRGKQDNEVKRLLDLIGLREQANDYPKTLSGGMKQRVAFARALYSKPDILLLDEPFGSLDEVKRRDLGDWLDRVKAHEHQTIIMVTHDLQEALRLSDHLLVLTKEGHQYYSHQKKQKIPYKQLKALL